MHRLIVKRLHVLAYVTLFFIVLLLGGKPLEAQTGESCEPLSPDPATWLTDGLLLVNESVFAIPMLAGPDLACTTEFASVVPGGRVKVLLDEGDFLYVMHANDNFRNGWVLSVGFSQVDIPLLPVNPDEPVIPVAPVVPAEPEVPMEPGTPAEPEFPVEPVVPVTPVVPETPAVPEAPAEPEIPSEPETPVEPVIAAPVIPADPEFPSGPVFPVDPEFPSQPVFPADPEPALGPVIPADPVSPLGPVTPPEPEVPVNSETPAEPEAPVVPELPAEPETPAEPEAPVEPEVPAEPETPAEPEAPVEPELPAEPETPAEPEVPVEPEVPAEPETPAEPEAPVEPEVPAEPETPAEPEVPVEPEVPAEPETPAEPESPLEPEVPAEPETPAEPEAPIEPEVPAEPETPAEPEAPVEPELPAEPETPAEPEAPVDPEVTIDPEVPAVSPIPASGYAVSGNTIFFADDGWYQVQAVTADGLIGICEGFQPCEVSNGTYIVINLTSGDRFENVIVAAESEVPTESEQPSIPETPDDSEPLPMTGFTITGNVIALPDDGWYQVQAVTADGVVSVCEGVRTCEVSAGIYIVVNLTSGERFENVQVVGLPSDEPDVPTQPELPSVPESPEEGQPPLTPGYEISDNTISLPDDGWYQVQAVTAEGIVNVCEGVRLCEVTAGTYIIINLTTGERFENAIVAASPQVPLQPSVPTEPQPPTVPDTPSDTPEESEPQPTPGFTISDNTISLPDDGWYQVQAITAEGIVSVCEGVRTCVVTTGSYNVINLTTGERFENVVVSTELEVPTVPEQPEVPESDQVIIPTSQVKPYLGDGPYAEALAECSFTSSPLVLSEICPLSKLPYIGQTTDDITVEHVMERTLVTHDWMGARLRLLLNEMPEDVLPLFAPITMLVIGSEVRPASFNALLGRLMIDPGVLWMTVPEKKTVSQGTDFRMNFGADLQFVSLWRWMRGDEFAIPPSSLLDEGTRGFESIIPQTASVLYHQLAHANDLVRPGNLDGLNPEATPALASGLFVDDRIAVGLYADAELTSRSSVLYGLAGVRFGNIPPSDFQKSLLADYVGSVMGNEGKQLFYSYFSIFEDVATLFEHTMMRYHFGIETHVGFMNKPEEHPDAACNDYRVAWGVRNRIASPLVAQRAKYVTESLIGESAQLDAFFSTAIGESSPLREGDGWCDARFQTPPEISGRFQDDAEDNRQFRFERELITFSPR